MNVTTAIAPDSFTISSEEVAEVLHCTVETVRQLLAQGVLPGMKPGKEWIIPRAAFTEAINAYALDQAGQRRKQLAQAAVSIPAGAGHTWMVPNKRGRPRKRPGP